MNQLRHRHDQAIGTGSLSSSPTSRKAKANIDSFRSGRKKTRRSIGILDGLIAIVVGSLFLYFLVAYYFIVDRNGNSRGDPQEEKWKSTATTAHISLTNIQRWNDAKNKRNDETYSFYTQKHIPIGLKELIPQLKSMKERFQSIESPSGTKFFKDFDLDHAVQLKKKRDKKGKVVYNPITAIKREDLTDMLGISPAEIKELSNITYDEAVKGREKLVDILNEAGIMDIDPIAISKLPKWSSVAKLYGEKPVILGLERCEEFRNTFPLDDASIGTAGMFNTGTNPFAMYISENCKLPHNKHDRAGGTRWQVPWGKHMLAERRWTNTAGRDFKVNKTNVMPIALVRDPYTWMQSMCKHGYEARWPHKFGSLCPNLAKPNLKGGKPEKVSVTVRYKPPAKFESLAHYWGEWYKQYLEADYPRLIVRFEDIQFHAKELIETVCECAGAVPRNKDAVFRFVVDSAKWGAAHKSTTNMISAMIKYGNYKNRFTGMKHPDFMVAKEVR